MGLISGIGERSGEGRVRLPSIEGVNQDYLGLLRGYQSGVPELFNTQSEYQPRYSDLFANEMTRLTPGTCATMEAASPGLSSLIQSVLASAKEGPMTYGADLPKNLLRLTNQTSRAGQAARGLGFGPSDVYGETGDAARMSNQLVDANRGFALNAATAAYNTQTDPFLRLLSGTVGAGRDQLMSPAGSTNLLQLPYQGRLQANLGTASNNTSLLNSSNSSFFGI